MFIPQNGLFIHALVSIHKPDAIRLWLCPDITAAEISLLGYSAARLDRDRHGSGIILFVADIYNVKVLQQGRSSWDLEFLLVSVQCAQLTRSRRPQCPPTLLGWPTVFFFVSVQCAQFKLSLAVLYQLPTSPTSYFDNLYSIFASFNPSLFSYNFVPQNDLVTASTHTSIR